MIIYNYMTSDHQIIRWDFIATKEISTVKDDVIRYDYFKGDYEKMREDSNKINWTEVVMGGNIEDVWERFKLLVETLRDKWIPVRSATKKKCKWITMAVIKSRRANIKAWNKCQGNKTEQNLIKDKEKLQKSVVTNRTAKLNYEQK